ncbi:MULTISPECIES: EAL domain-containing protein [unclassified Sulfurimonas]|uniref:EAL domain-containing protein n=1 Tax=Sulfurimonas sp. RIFOXYD12_FULL_33_39 TaxID=1802259 RepID=UPI0025CBA5FE|nr:MULTISPECIES: EAL domain-containing protein [unclassified Sulfurimonas]
MDSAFTEVVRGICNYAHKLGKEVILEGIETEDDLYLAKECRVDFVQGFLFKEQFILA